MTCITISNDLRFKHGPYPELSHIGVALYIDRNNYVHDMAFFKLENPRHQAELMGCVPTTLKVLFENQFSINLSLRVWKIRTKWGELEGVIPYKSLRDLEEGLSRDYKIQVNEKVGLTEKELENMLNRGILPLVYVPATYHETAEEPHIDPEGDELLHAIIPVGIEDGHVYVYDAFKKGYGDTLPKAEVKVKLPISKFLKVWERTQRRAFWFDKIPAKDKQLGDFIK